MRTIESIHLKGLNGIRAIAALAVVVSHVLQYGRRINLPLNEGIDLAGFGVSIFFSLSGFLITYLLLLEKERFASINIRAFYIRRILRIWPLYFIYLVFSLVVIRVFQLHELPGSGLYYFLMAANIPFLLGTALPLVGHYWSLGVEEQFYLIWPWIVKNSARLIRVLVVLIFVFLVLKTGARLLQLKQGIVWPYMVIHINRFECMAIGAIGAFYFVRGYGNFLRFCFQPFIQLIPWVAICLMVINKFHVISIFDNDLTAVFTVILIVNVAANEKAILRLDYKLFEFLGRISYGIYVFHPIIIFFTARLLTQCFAGLSNTVTYFLFIIIVLIGTILVAWASYQFFEKRFLRLKTRFARIQTAF